MNKIRKSLKQTNKQIKLKIYVKKNYLTSELKQFSCNILYIYKIYIKKSEKVKGIIFLKSVIYKKQS